MIKQKQNLPKATKPRVENPKKLQSLSKFPKVNMKAGRKKLKIPENSGKRRKIILNSQVSLLRLLLPILHSEPPLGKSWLGTDKYLVSNKNKKMRRKILLQANLEKVRF